MPKAVANIVSADPFINADPFALARTVEPVRDPIRDLIAEHDRLVNLGVGFRSQADVAIYALGDAERRRLRLEYPDEEDMPEPFGRLYAEAQRYEGEAFDIHDRIVATKPASLDGAIAQLERCDMEHEPAIAMVLEWLRDIAAKGGAA